MGLSKMSSKERAIVAVLGVIILIALAGIGLLAARLITDREPSANPTTVVTALPPATITAVVPPAPAALADTPAVDVDEPVRITRVKGAGPGLPAIIPAQALHPGRRYRIEIAAADGSRVKVNGSWSQGVVTTGGAAAAPQIEFFEGDTPYQIAVESPVPPPQTWSVSVSAGPADILSTPVLLVITIWDVTEEK